MANRGSLPTESPDPFDPHGNYHKATRDALYTLTHTFDALMKTDMQAKYQMDEDFLRNAMVNACIQHCVIVYAGIGREVNNDRSPTIRVAEYLSDDFARKLFTDYFKGHINGIATRFKESGEVG